MLCPGEVSKPAVMSLQILAVMAPGQLGVGVGVSQAPQPCGPAPAAGHYSSAAGPGSQPVLTARSDYAV